MRKAWLIPITIVSVSALALGGAYYYKYAKGHPHHVQVTLAQLASMQFQLPQVTTNTSDSHLVQMQITVQANDTQSFTDLKSAQNQVADILNTTIHENTAAEFISTDGLTQFKRQVLSKIRALLPQSDHVSSVDINSVLEQ